MIFLLLDVCDMPAQKSRSERPAQISWGAVFHYVIGLRIAMGAYLTFVTYITFVICREMWRNIIFLQMTDVEKSQISPHLLKMSPHARCGGVVVANM